MVLKLPLAWNGYGLWCVAVDVTEFLLNRLEMGRSPVSIRLDFVGREARTKTVYAMNETRVELMCLVDDSGESFSSRVSFCFVLLCFLLVSADLIVVTVLFAVEGGLR